MEENKNYVSPDMETVEYCFSEVICQSGSIPNLVLDENVNWFDE